MAISSEATRWSALKLLTSNLSASPICVSFVPPKQIHMRVQRTVANRETAITAAGTGPLRGGGAVLERPTFDQSQFDAIPLTQEGGDIGRLGERRGMGSGDSYRVLLVDDVRHNEKLVEKALPMVVPSVTADEARKLFRESRENGVAVVIVTVKEHAEFYAQMMVRHGLRSAIEPDSDLAN